jgi:hypothetical protein
MKVGAYTAPTHIYVALLTDATTECTGTGYARVICDAWNAATDADPTVVDNTSIIDFGSAGGSNWGTISHFRLSDASSGTTNWLSDATALSTSKTINNGDPVTFPAGALDVTLD